MSRRRGLTMVEVLVAVVVCGAGLAIAATGVAGALRGEGHAADLDRAARHLELLLGRLEGGVVKVADATGDFGEDGADDLTWSVKIATGAAEGLVDATVSVAWVRHDQPRDLTVVRTFFTDPLAATGGQ
jgi:prepilin-type N-terminal cleavage/methylation domain-containing protein